MMAKACSTCTCIPPDTTRKCSAILPPCCGTQSNTSLAEGYLAELSRSKRVASVEQLVDDFWDRNYSRIKPWYQPESDDVILTASFGLTVGEACRRLGVRNLVASEVDVETMKVTYLNFSTNKAKRFRELYGPDAVIDEFYTDSKFDQPMIDMARHAFMVKGNTITQVK